MDLEKQSFSMPHIALISVKVNVLSIAVLHTVLKDPVIFAFHKLVSLILWYIEPLLEC